MFYPKQDKGELILNKIANFNCEIFDLEQNCKLLLQKVVPLDNTLTPLQGVTDSQLLKVLLLKTATLTKYSCPLPGQ